MKIDILTLFPEMFAPLKVSMLGRAVEKDLIEGALPWLDGSPAVFAAPGLGSSA